MKYGIPTLPALLAFIPVLAFGQGPLNDKVVIDFANPVHISDQVIPAGHYELRQLSSSGAAARVMLIDSNGGTRYEGAAITVPMLNNNTPNDTRAVVQRVGQNYYLDKIWIAGKDYGYQFEIPSDVKSRMKEVSQPLTVNMRFSSPQIAEAPQPGPRPAPVAAAPPPEPRPAPAAAPPPREEPREVAQAAPPQPPPAPEQPKSLPSTASNWAMLASLGVFSCAAAAVFRKFANRHGA
jgi:hypothetical protein